MTRSIARRPEFHCRGVLEVEQEVGGRSRPHRVGPPGNSWELHTGVRGSIMILCGEAGCKSLVWCRCGTNNVALGIGQMRSDMRSMREGKRSPQSEAETGR